MNFYNHKNVLTADEMVNKFLNTSNSIGKANNAFVPSKFSGSAFHCPYFIKRISHEKHLAYLNIKSLHDMNNVDAYLEQFDKYYSLCNLLRKIKSKFRSARYKANIVNIGNHFLNKEYREGWKSLKKVSKPSFSIPRTSTIKSKEGYDIVSPKKQLARWAEHYTDLASDQSGHNLDRQYWSRVFRGYTFNPIVWNIND